MAPPAHLPPSPFPRPVLDGSVSLFLDLARVSAALLVLLHHTFGPPFHTPGVHVPGRSAVIVFFVISGFVIAYATDGERDWRRYVTARAARIYSVAIPALVLTGLLHAAGIALWGGGSQPVESQPLLRLLVSTVFVNQWWNLTVTPLANGPFWSLCYEVWYYVAFGCWLLMRGHSRWVALAILAAAVGPRILLLAPPWLLGVMLYGRMKAAQAANEPARPLRFWFFAMLFLVMLFGADPADRLSQAVRATLDDGYWRVGGFGIFIGGDWRFPSDYLLAAVFAATVRHAAAAFPASFRNGRAGRAIREASSYTFSLYLYHAPLLVFLHAAARKSVPAAVLPWVTTGLLLAGAVALGHYTERRKQPWVRAVARLLRRRGAVDAPAAAVVTPVERGRSAP